VLCARIAEIGRVRIGELPELDLQHVPRVARVVLDGQHRSERVDGRDAPLCRLRRARLVELIAGVADAVPTRILLERVGNGRAVTQIVGNAGAVAIEDARGNGHSLRNAGGARRAVRVRTADAGHVQRAGCGDRVAEGAAAAVPGAGARDR